MKAHDAKEFKRLREENQRLKRMVAQRDVDIEILREAARGTTGTADDNSRRRRASSGPDGGFR
jgi:hypothetical protein